MHSPFIVRRAGLFAFVLFASAASLAVRADTAPPPAQSTQASLAGAIAKTGPLSFEELKALGPTEQTWTNHGQAHRVLGVRLDRLLTARGFAPGPMGKDVPKAEKRAGYRKAILISAADGYQSLLSCAEISEEIGPTVALLIWELDGAPLDASAGPLRLVVLTDHEPSRSIYGVRRIELVDVPTLTASHR